MEVSMESVELVRDVIPNFQIISASILRGGQPEEEGFRRLKGAGVRSVVSLCQSESGLLSLFRRGSTSSPAADNEVTKEERLVSGLGMSFFSVPLDVFSAPPEEAINNYLRIVSNKDNWPVFTHCQHGRDRTGLMTGVYRVTCDGWSYDQAFEEMVKFGFDRQLTNLSDALVKHCSRISR